MKTLLSGSNHKKEDQVQKVKLFYQFEGNSNGKIGECSSLDKQNQIVSDQNNRRLFADELGQDKYSFQGTNYKQQTTQLRKIDLNRTSNINTILNQTSSNNRSQSRSQSPSQQDNGKFISFKKNLTYEQSKQQRYSLASQQRNEEQNQVNNQVVKNRSKSNLSTSSSQRKSPNVVREKQSINNNNNKQNIRIIKLQLEQEKKQRNNSNSSRKNSNSKLDKIHKNQQQNQEVSQQHVQVQNEDNYDFFTAKNSARGNKNIMQVFNDQQILQAQKHQSSINSPISKNLNRNANSKNEVSLDTYDKKLQTKIDFNKIDQKFDKKNILVFSGNHSKNISDLQESQLIEQEEVKKHAKLDNNSKQQGLSMKSNNQDLENKLDKQMITGEKNNLAVTEFEMLEQSIQREEQEKKYKGISNKKLSNQSSGFSNSNYNNYFSNATPTSDSLKHLHVAIENDNSRKDQRSSSGIGQDTDNNSLSSSIHRSNDLTNNKLDLPSKLEFSKPPSSQISSSKPQKVYSVLSLSQQSSQQPQQETSLNNCNKPNSNKVKNSNDSQNVKQTNYKSNSMKCQPEEIASKLICDSQDICFNQNQQAQKKAQSGKKNNPISKLPNKNISPTLFTSRSQQQLNYVSECSKKLFQESQDIGINKKSKENIALFKQALETRNKALRGSGFTSAKAVSPSTRYTEVKKMHSINQNIICNNLQNNQKGSLTSRNNNVQDNNQNQNHRGDQSNKNLTSDNNSIITTTTTNTINKCKTQISTPIQKQNNNSINSVFKTKASDSKQNSSSLFNNQVPNKNSSNYFLGNFQSINSIQTTISKTEICLSSNQMDDSHCESSNAAKSPSQRYYLDYQNKQAKNQPISPSFKTDTKNNSKSINKPHQSNTSADLTYTNNYTQEQANRKSNNQRDQENRKSDLLTYPSNIQNYNFINEKSSIINKISGNYKVNEKNNLERSFNLITPSKSTLTRQIQLASNQQDTSLMKINEKQLERDRSRDHSLDRKQNNIASLGQKSQNKKKEGNQFQQTEKILIQLDDCSQINENSNKIKLPLHLQKDSITTSLSKIDIKDSINLSKIPTVQSNLITNSQLKQNEKSKNSQLNISNISLQKQSNIKNNLDIKEVQIQPSLHSTFNFKPSYFTPLNYEDLSDYIDPTKRNSSPNNLINAFSFKK